MRVSTGTLISLHRLILRLLQDDDEQIRIEAAETLREGLRLKRDVSQKRAMELEWEFIGARLNESAASTAWFDLVRSAVFDRQSFGKSGSL